MNDKNFALDLIRKYHTHLLGYANRDVRTRNMLKKAEFMDFSWKHEVAQLIIEGKKEAKEIIGTIRNLRKEYGCREF